VPAPSYEAYRAFHEQLERVCRDLQARHLSDLQELARLGAGHDELQQLSFVAEEQMRLVREEQMRLVRERFHAIPGPPSGFRVGVQGYDEAYWQNEEYRQRWRERTSGAWDLLVAHLTPTQRSELQQSAYFTVRSADGRRLYRLDATIYMGNIRWVHPSGAVLGKYCVHTFGGYAVPIPEHLLAQKLHLETDDLAYLSLACVMFGSRPPGCQEDGPGAAERHELR
jgi:hypothetical protein